MAYNLEGLKYFIYNITINNNKALELPKEIRQLIWKFAHYYPYIQCYICDKVLISFEINTSNNLITENFSIINGLTKCSQC
jgi:hypothetical protein